MPRKTSAALLAVALALIGCQASARASGRFVDLSRSCAGSNCDAALSHLRPGFHYQLPAGVWTFSKPVRIPSNVALTGDGTGLTGTDLVYTGPPTGGAVVTAGGPHGNWVNGHIAGVEIETQQLHQLRVRGDTPFATVRISQAATGLEIVNPTGSSTVTDVNVWKFGSTSVLIDNHALRPGKGVFQFSQFFVGTSPHAIDVRGSSAMLLFRYGGIDFGPLSEAGMLFSGGRRGPGAVVESVKIEGDYDIPGYVVTGGAPVAFVGTTRYLNQSLFAANPLNGAPAFLERGRTGALQCLGCTALGERTALALLGSSRAIPTAVTGIDLHRLDRNGQRLVARALAAPETPVPRPQNVIDLGSRCPGHNCDGALAGLREFGRYHLPAGVWTFSRPFTIPSNVTFFGDGSGRGGTVLRYVGPSIPGDAAVRFGAGNGDMSAGRLFSLRIDTRSPLSGGFGVRARDATNASTIEEISISGFPDGQLELDATPGGLGSGPNFFKVARFSLTGGAHPLLVDGGRQTLLLEHGNIQLGPTSQDGLYLSGGEQLAATRVVESVTVTGRRNVPGFRVQGPAVTTFIRSSRIARGRLSAPGFLYTAIAPRRATECLLCSVRGARTGFSMPQLGVRVRARRGRKFDFLNPSLGLQTVHAPFDATLPGIAGAAVVGQTLTVANGNWTNDPTGYAYQWYRCKPPDVPSNPATRCAAIAGATGPAYTVTNADKGLYLRVSVAATNGFGAQPATSLPVLVS